MTSGQVALSTGSLRDAASSSTLLATPCALKMVTRIRRHFGEVLDEARALGLEALHHVLVVHDLVAHIDRRTEFLQRPFDDLDGAHDAGAKTARLGEYHFHQDLPAEIAGYVRDCGHCAASCGLTRPVTRFMYLAAVDTVTINPGNPTAVL